MTHPIADNLTRIRKKMADAARRAGRAPQAIKLIAVTKKKSPAEILMAVQHAQYDFAESYIQDFAIKHNELAGNNINWHFIGHIQRNKAKKIVGQVCLIHSLDRMTLASEINKLSAEKRLVQDCLVQVKIADEESKSGCAIADLFSFVHALGSLSHINIKGLMTIGSLTEDLTQTRSEFRAMKTLCEKINKDHIYKSPLTELSMGMSSDYTVAIEEGATLIRVGTDLFGERDPHNT
ncbi:MAG: YggS family pyridoxal phosphate-dependent enzyme [Deltaproteobacteria bacterium]|nr:YggS family pyridoxal phosphate-dependent enzyme [Deltaproteobacteria bacterium]